MEKLSLPVVIEKDADGYFAYCPQLQGCYTQGDTYEEALENIRDAIGLHIEDRLADDESLPELEAISVIAVEIPDEKLAEYEDELMLANPRIMAEIREARTIARQIALHPLSRDPVVDNHLGEAQAMALAARPEFVNDVLLVDELAARMVAEQMGLTISGFAGVLLVAVQEGLLTASELKERLEACRQQGTHYSEAFIEQVYLAVKGDR